MLSPTAALLIILISTLVLFITQVVRIEITALGAMAALVLTGVLEPAEALAGFSNPATVTVAAMLVLSAGLEKSGAIDLVAARVVRLGAGGYHRLLAALCLPAALFSAFMNNTPIVAFMIPVAVTLGRRFEIAPSRLLLPISFMAILGGTCTLIGTSTNILVDSLSRQAGGPGFGMFEFASLGLVYFGVGACYILLFARRLLPERLVMGQSIAATSPDQFVTEVRVPPKSRLAGKQIGDVLHGAEKVTPIELVRGEDVILSPTPELIIQEGDVLLVESSARAIHKLLAEPQLQQGSESGEEPVQAGHVDLQIAEAVLTPNSTLRYRNVRELGLNRRYGVQLLAVRRLGLPHNYKLRRLRIRAGDVLLVQGKPEALRLLEENGDFLLIDRPSSTFTVPSKTPLAIVIMALVVALAFLNVAPIVILAVAGVALMLLLRCLEVNNATRALDSGVLLLLAGTIPLGIAMEKTGIASTVANSVVHVGEEYGVVVLVSSFYLLASVLTEVISNNATAVLLTPIGMSIAAQLGIDPKPVLVAIAFGGSASFASPIGYQTNTMVMGPGGYFFRDYLRFGLPLNVLMWLTATCFIPVFWPA